VQQVGPVTGGELAAGLLLDDLPADRIEGVVLPPGLLPVGADPDQTDERHHTPRSSNVQHEQYEQ
jgi:hypothetical protein